MDKQQDIYDALVLKLKGSKYYQSPLMAYHELFADTGAVMFTGDPHVMKSILYYSGTKEKYLSRDFSNRLRIKGLNETESHALFAPARSFIWKFILDTPAARRNKGLFMKRIFSVIESELQKQLELADLGTELQSPESLNQSLIEGLALEFEITLH